MPIIGFSEKDILRGTIVTPAWYRVHIEGVGEKPSRDGNSINYVVEGTIVMNAEDGSKDFAGVPLEWNFNSKAISFMIPYFAAHGVEIEAGKRYELQATAGADIDIFVENDIWEGRPVNRVNHKYRKMIS